MLNLIEQKIGEAVEVVLGQPVVVEVGYAQAEFGEFATNVALRLAGQLKRSPVEIGQKIAAKLTDQIFDSVDVAGNGFINVKMSDGFWAGQLAKVNENYGKIKISQPQKVQVEFISANPTGPLTLANARGGFIGDAVARVLEAAGHQVTREYYFNNAGNQINKLVESVKVAAGLIRVEDRQYGGVYIDELARDFKTELETKTDDELKPIIANAIFERYIRPAVERMGIKFDVWFNESDLIADGSLERAIKRLDELGLVSRHDGAVWVKSGEGGDPREERVLVKSDGEPTYLAPDIAHHLNIFETRGFDWAITELGPDHVAQFPSVQAVMKLLVPAKKLQMVGHQQMRLIAGGQEVKMSKRAGTFVTVDDLVEAVGADVARFFILMRAAETHLDFDLDLAKEESQKNPYWYAMYAYVRSNSIIAKAASQKLRPADEFSSNFSPIERRMVTVMTKLEPLVEELAVNFQVHKLTYLAVEAASVFHDFYEHERIINLAPKVAAEKLMLVDRYRLFMEALFGLIGITPQAKM